MIKVICPLEVYLTPKKKVILNLNWYRNAHFHQLSDAKNALVEIIQAPQTIPHPCEIEFHYYAKTKALMDVSNPIAVIEKFVCDALVKKGCLPDDNRNIITRSRGWTYMGVDKENPRCEVLFWPVE